MAALTVNTTWAGDVDDFADTWGLTRCSFFDDFKDITATIDINDEGDETKLWFPHNAWPNAGDPIGTNWQDYPPTAPSSIVQQAASVLRVTTDSGPFGLSLSTARSFANSAGYIGRFFTPPFYIKATIAHGAPAQNGIAIWLAPRQFVVNGSQNLNEFDIVEYNHVTNRNYGSIQRWFPVIEDRELDSFDYPAGTDDGNMHSFGLGVIPMSMNGGTGIFQLVFNGTDVAASTTNWTTGQSYAYGDDNGHEYMVMIGAGNGFPINVDRIQVFQLP